MSGLVIITLWSDMFPKLQGGMVSSTRNTLHTTVYCCGLLPWLGSDVTNRNVKNKEMMGLRHSQPPQTDSPASMRLLSVTSGCAHRGLSSFQFRVVTSLRTKSLHADHDVRLFKPRPCFTKDFTDLWTDPTNCHLRRPGTTHFLKGGERG